MLWELPLSLCVDLGESGDLTRNHACDDRCVMETHVLRAVDAPAIRRRWFWLRLLLPVTRSLDVSGRARVTRRVGLPEVTHEPSPAFPPPRGRALLTKLARAHAHPRGAIPESHDSLGLAARAPTWRLSPHAPRGPASAVSCLVACLRASQ